MARSVWHWTILSLCLVSLLLVGIAGVTATGSTVESEGLNRILDHLASTALFEPQSIDSESESTATFSEDEAHHFIAARRRAVADIDEELHLFDHAMKSAMRCYGSLRNPTPDQRARKEALHAASDDLVRLRNDYDLLRYEEGSLQAWRHNTHMHQTIADRIDDVHTAQRDLCVARQNSKWRKFFARYLRTKKRGDPVPPKRQSLKTYLSSDSAMILFV